MAYNKFKTKSGIVLLDLTNDDVTSETLVKGITAHNRHGEIIKGTYEPLVPVLQEKFVTKNGEVLPDEQYDGLSRVIVNVPTTTLKKFDGAVVIE